MEEEGREGGGATEKLPKRWRSGNEKGEALIESEQDVDREANISTQQQT